MHKHQVLFRFLVLCLLCVFAFAAPVSARPYTKSDRELQDLCNSHESFQRLMKKAEAGDAEALADHGWCRSTAFPKGLNMIERNDSYAAQMLRKAADKGHARGMARLGVLYLDGKGVPEDERRAVQLFRKAAEQGDGYGQAQLGIAYLSGFGGLPKDERRSVEWVRKAAEQGDEWGQLCLGIAYANGLGGLPKSRDKAVEWLRKAKAQGNVPAKLVLEHKFGERYSW